MVRNKDDISKLKEAIEKFHERFSQEMLELRESQKKTDQQIGRLTDGWGKFVEGLVEPSIPKLFGELGIEISMVYQRARSRKDGRELEIDILAIGKRIDGGKVVIAVEVKSTLGVREVKECIEDLNSFFDFFDEYRGRELIGVVSGIRLTSGVQRHAEKEGLYILGPADDNMVILNKKGFKPKIWK